MKLRKMLAVVLTVAMVMSLLPVVTVAAADTSGGLLNAGGENSSIVFTKELIPAGEDKSARIKLEAYVKGKVSASSSGRPTDIIMVLDQSGSMDDMIAVSDTESQSKLDIMKDAVQTFSEEVASFNTENDDRYRIAIVGFASEDSNTEVLTLGKSKSQVENNVEYSYEEVDSNSLNTGKNYYIRLGNNYTQIYYLDNYFWYSDGWYYGDALDRTAVDVSEITVYNRSAVLYPDYRNAFVNCTSGAVASGGAITSAVNNLDGNGATRADLGFEMAEKIIEAQPEGTYAERDKIIIFITDGVPTTSSSFSSTVANNAVSYAKTMKDNKAHVYSLYIGSPTAQAESFMKAVSSNYPGAVAYDNLGDAAASSYYAAAGNAAQIIAVLEEIKYTIATDSALSEKSVVMDEISDYFRLPVINGGVYDPSQVSIYTVDKTASDWAEEVPFSAASVQIEEKTVKVEGFNFAYHCVTEEEKYPGSGDYGRKLVIYIPIIADENNDNFGGYLPTNDDAGIFNEATDETPVITAEGEYSELEISYSMVATEKWYHLDGVGERTKEFSFEDETVMGEILDIMIPKVPNGKNNAGVDMTYEIWSTNETPSDRSDDERIATLTVSAGTSVDVTDISNWTIESGKESVILDADGVDNRIYAINCVLESINPDETISTEVYALLDIGVVAPNVHIVGGEIDLGGRILVNGTDKGLTYVQQVAEGNDSEKMVFSLESGYEFSKIRIDTNNHEGEITSDVIYDIENGIDNAASYRVGDNYEFAFTNVQHGTAVVVETRPVTYTLITNHDDNSQITAGHTYIHSDTEKLPVNFGVYSGYEIASVTVDGTTYKTAEEMENAGITIMTEHNSYNSDGTTHRAVTRASLTLPRTGDHEVSVTSKKRLYKVEYKDYIREYSGGIFTYTERGTTAPVYVEFGASLPSVPYSVGEEQTIGSDNYTLSDWYNDYNGYAFSNVVDTANATVPANDVILYAFWARNPNIDVGTVKIVKNTDVDAGGKTFTFKAFLHEHEAGSVTITGEGEAYMTITLTDRQNDYFEHGEVIRIREDIPLDDDEWYYDSTIYNLVYDAGGNVLKNGNTVVTEAIFTNIKNSYTVKYDLAGGLVNGSELAPRTVKWNDNNLYGIDDIPVKTAHTFAGWKYDNTDVKTSDTYGDLAENKTVKEITLVAQYETRSYTVKYDLNGGNIDGTEAIADKYVGYLDRELLPSGTAVRDGYTLINWTYGEKVVTNANTYASLANNHDVTSITLVANWEVDEIGGNPDPEKTPDGIPDKYQKIVTYKIKGGTWDGTNKADIVEVVTLRDAQGKYAVDGTAAINVPDSENFRPDVNHEENGKGWANPQPPANSIVSGVHPETFTYIFHKRPDVEYPEHNPDEPTPTTEVDEYDDLENILVDPNGGVWNYDGTDHTDPHEIELTENISLGDADRDKHVFSGWVKSEPTDEQKAEHGDDIVAVYTAQWDKDEIGGNPDPGETPDDIADKYQKKITFKIVNGKWEDGTAEDKVYVVDLLTTGNKYSVNGTADITGIIPVNMTAVSGYSGGEWDTTPPNTVSGEEAVVYTYSYTASGGGGGGGGGTKKYKLTYETNGGNEIKSETHSSGKTVNLVKVPVKTGYAFEGWYLDEALTESVTKVKMTRDITVYAGWVEDNGNAGHGHETPGSLNGKDHFAYVVGYPDGTVRPNSYITRAEVTSIFFRLLTEDLRNANLSNDNNFMDVDSDDWFNTAVSTMARLGIVEGRKADKFDPNANITRAEFAAICARFDNSEYEIADNFTDVSGHWAEDEIHEAAAHGWIRGYEDGTFKPDRYITRAEAMTMINRVLNRIPEKSTDLLDGMTVWPDNSDKTAWYYLPIQEATNSHDYKMKNHIYEKWTKLGIAEDWTRYQ